MIAIKSNVSRLQNALINSGFNLVFRVGNILITFVITSILLRELGQEHYGIWATIFSMIQWSNLFDLGLGHGLRNEFAKARADGLDKIAKELVSTGYFLMLLIAGIIIITFCIVDLFVDWKVILNCGENMANQANIAFRIIVISYLLRFVFNLINYLLHGAQKTAKTSMLLFINNLLVLLVVTLGTKYYNLNLVILSIVFGGVPLIVYLISSIYYYYYSIFSQYRPSLNYVKSKHIKSLFVLGIRFFVIQISFILLFQSSIIIVAQILGPGKVSELDVTQKLAGVILTLFTVVVTPFWSAFTDAYARNEIKWMHSVMQKGLKGILGLCLFGILLYSLSDILFKFWLGENYKANHILFAMLILLNLISSLNGLYSNFFNGIGKIKIQMILAIVTSLLNVPLAIMLTKKIGIEGVVLATIITTIPATIIYPIHYKKIILRKQKGIWNE